MAGSTRSQVGPYRLLRLLSAGGEASVFEAEDTRLGRRVAVKLRPLPEDRAQRSSQLQEARALAALSHPLIMQLHDVLELPDALALVLELVRGRDLASLLEAAEVTPGMAVHIGLDLCSALAAAHDAGIVHGDLKAANVLVTRDGHLKLFDFGLSRPAGTVLPAGSAYGLAPEQLLGQPPDQRTDLFALGCLLYRLLLGEHPFPVGGGDWQQQRLAAVPARPAATAAGLPTELLDLVFELLAADPLQRPASARAVRQRLLTLSRDLPAGEAAALAGLASEVEQARRDRPLASYRAQPAPEPRQRFRFRGLALAMVATALLGTALYPRELAKSPVAVHIEGVYVTGAATIGVAKLESTLQQLIDRKPGLTPVQDGEDAVIALHVNCASEVCSSQLVWRQGAEERSDTRALLVADSELAWQRRLSQGLAELSP